MTKQETFKQARERLFAEVRDSPGWELRVVDTRTFKPLKVPYAERSDGARIWFKTQALYYTHGSMKRLTTGRSLVDDMRGQTFATHLEPLLDRLLDD